MNASPALKGLALVTKLELMQRVRSTKWYVALAAWLVGLGVITGLATALVSWLAGGFGHGAAWLFGIIVMFTLFIALLVVPAVTSGSINGDRAAGTLATLQATLLRPWQIALGKVLAGWIAALAFLVIALPFLTIAVVAGSIGVWALVRVVAVLALIMLGISGLGIGISSVTSRPIGSGLLTYLVVALLAFLTPVLFVMALPLVTSQQDVTYMRSDWVDDGTDYGSESCTLVTESQDVLRTDRTVWLLYANPFVTVASVGPGADPDSAAAEPLSLISWAVTYAAHPTDPANVDQCDERPSPLYNQIPAWVYGVVMWTALGAAGTLVAERRLRTPARRLPAGQRIA